jgi:tetratricopeptide (TPR) repeat protein
VLIDIFKKLVKTNQSDQAIHLLDEAVMEADKLKDCDDRDYELIDIGEAYAEIGLYEKAIKVGLMIEDDYRRDWRLFDSIATLAIDKGNDEQIANIASAINYSPGEDNFLLRVVEIYCYESQIEKAIALISHITSSSMKAQALVTVVQNSYQTILQNELLDLLHQAENYNFGEENTRTKAQTLAMIAECYINLKEFIYAQNLLEEAKKLATSFYPNHLLIQIPHDFILTCIANALAKLPNSEST